MFTTLWQMFCVPDFTWTILNSPLWRLYCSCGNSRRKRRTDPVQASLHVNNNMVKHRSILFYTPFYMMSDCFIKKRNSIQILSKQYMTGSEFMGNLVYQLNKTWDGMFFLGLKSLRQDRNWNIEVKKLISLKYCQYTMYRNLIMI